MQFGIFSVGDVTTDPTTGSTPTGARAHPGDGRARAQGGGGRPGRVRHGRAPQPAVRALVAHHDAGLDRRPHGALQLSTATTLITTSDPVKIAEDFAMLQHLAGGRVDLMLGRGNTGPVYPWFGQDIRNGHAARGRELRPPAPTVARGRGRLAGPVPHAAHRLHLHAPAAGRRAAVRVARLHPQPRRSRSRPRSTATASSTTTSSGPRSTRSAWSTCIGAGSSTTATAPRSTPSWAWEARCSCATTRRRRSASSGPTSTTRRCTAAGPSLEDYMADTPLTVGSPQQVIDRTPGLPGGRRRLPAPAVPDGPCGAAAARSSWSRWRCWASWSCRCCARSSRQCGPRASRTHRPTRACSRRPGVPRRTAWPSTGRWRHCRPRPDPRRPDGHGHATHRGRDRGPGTAVRHAAAGRPARRRHGRRAPRAGRPGGGDRVRGARPRPGPGRTTC